MYYYTIIILFTRSVKFCCRFQQLDTPAKRSRSYTNPAVARHQRISRTGKLKRNKSRGYWLLDSPQIFPSRNSFFCSLPSIPPRTVSCCIPYHCCHHLRLPGQTILTTTTVRSDKSLTTPFCNPIATLVCSTDFAK